MRSPREEDARGQRGHQETGSEKSVRSPGDRKSAVNEVTKTARRERSVRSPVEQDVRGQWGHQDSRPKEVSEVTKTARRERSTRSPGDRK